MPGGPRHRISCCEQIGKKTLTLCSEDEIIAFHCFLLPLRDNISGQKDKMEKHTQRLWLHVQQQQKKMIIFLVSISTRKRLSPDDH